MNLSTQTPGCSTDIRGVGARRERERGTATVVALFSMLLMLGLGAALVLTTTTETMVAGNFWRGLEALYAADAGVERVMQELRVVPDWNPLLNGSRTSAFVDGQAGGTRLLADGTIIDLSQATNVINCNRTTTCSAADMDAVTEYRPWSTNNPRWRLYAYGPLAQMQTGIATTPIISPDYVIVWVADDQFENDGDPATDGASPANPGSGVLAIRAEGFGPMGTHRAIEATVGRTTTTGVVSDPASQQGSEERVQVRVLSWRDVG